MKKLLKQRAIYNLNSNQEMFKILDQLSLEQLTEQRGGCITGSVDPTVTTLDLVAHNAYIFIYLYKIFHKKRIKSVYNQELLDYQLSSLRMNPSDTYESLKALTFKLDEELINFMENLDMTSYDAEDFTAPDLYDVLSQTAAGWIEHLLSHQIHHRGQISQITSELNYGADISQFRLFGY